MSPTLTRMHCARVCCLQTVFTTISKNDDTYCTCSVVKHVTVIVLRVYYISRKGGTGGGGWGHLQGDMHMVVARLSCQSAMVGTMWANSCPGCMDRL